MSDHADVIRDVLVTVKQTASNHGLASNAAKAIHALDAERLDAEAEIADTEASLRRMYDRAKAAEARVTELEAAMTPMPDAVRDLTHAYHDLTTATGTENIKAALRRGDAARDILFAVEDAARAALTKEDTA